MQSPSEKKPTVSLHKIYLKDASFESSKTPHIFAHKDWAPKVNLQVNTESKPLKDDQFDVTLTITVTVKLDSDIIYIVEIKQAGLFTVSGLEKQQLQAVLATFCPTTLFPYAREAVSNLVEKGGFPQLLLQPINFDTLYAKHLDELKQASAAKTKVIH